MEVSFQTTLPELSQYQYQSSLKQEISYLQATEAAMTKLCHHIEIRKKALKCDLLLEPTI